MKFVNKKKRELSDEFWNILVVDDEEEVHSITNIVLRNFIFQNKKVRLFDTYNIADTKKILRDKDNFALIFLDIVMESDDAGLLLTKFIREELNNHTTRIILRTGQPGSAPEQKIIIDYDINDYKEKTELTATKLTTSVVSSLRSYDELIKIKKHEQSLEIEIKSILNELGEKNSLIQNEILSLDNSELMSEISQQFRVPLEEIKIEINDLILKLNVNEVNVNVFKDEVNIIYNKINNLSDKINSYKN